jgi:hypothetical protein
VLHAPHRSLPQGYNGSYIKHASPTVCGDCSNRLALGAMGWQSQNGNVDWSVDGK